MAVRVGCCRLQAISPLPAAGLGAASAQCKPHYNAAWVAVSLRAAGAGEVPNPANRGFVCDPIP
ncbi:MAG: hypothetical protein DWI64_06225 [Chloroflexi bacterium]|nr:MAG: hypothetical protein DWI64_06225 [Chloroflexota bacterium]